MTPLWPPPKPPPSLWPAWSSRAAFPSRSMVSPISMVPPDLDGSEPSSLWFRVLSMILHPLSMVLQNLSMVPGPPSGPPAPLYGSQPSSLWFRLLSMIPGPPPSRRHHGGRSAVGAGAAPGLGAGGAGAAAVGRGGGGRGPAPGGPEGEPGAAAAPAPPHGADAGGAAGGGRDGRERGAAPGALAEVRPPAGGAWPRGAWSSWWTPWGSSSGRRPTPG